MGVPLANRPRFRSNSDSGPASRAFARAAREHVGSIAASSRRSGLGGLPQWDRDVEARTLRAGNELSRFLLGSLAEKVVRHAPCSVLVTRAQGATAPWAAGAVSARLLRRLATVELAAKLAAPGVISD
jgi:hypothetical protein